MTIRLSAAVFAACLAATCAARAAANVDTTWKQIDSARTSGTFEIFDLVAPKGSRLCGPPPDFAASNGELIPIDPSVTCDRFDQKHPDHFPDAVYIIDWADAAMTYRNVKDVARDACSAKAVMLPAGKVMGGLETIICTEDLGSGVAEDLALAYYGEPENGFEIRIASIYHRENRARADALQREILSRIKIRFATKK